MNPLVSVILLTYNHKNYIAQAIDSVLEQKVTFNYELLIGDDCSTDGTCEIVDSYFKKYPNLVKTVRSKQNVGPVKNEKRLIEESKGKYIAFLEGDDYWVDTLKLQKQIDFLESNPDYGLVHGDVNHYFEETKKTIFSVNKYYKKPIYNGNIYREILKPDPLFIKTATTCFRKELLKHFDFEKAINENWVLTDLPLWIDLSYNSKIYYFEDVFATYRLLKESASRTSSLEKRINYHKNVFKIKQHYFNKYNIEVDIINNLTHDYYLKLLRYAFKQQNYHLMKEVKAYFKKSAIRLTFSERTMIYLTKLKIRFRNE